MKTRTVRQSWVRQPFVRQQESCKNHVSALEFTTLKNTTSQFIWLIYMLKSKCWEYGKLGYVVSSWHMTVSYLLRSELVVSNGGINRDYYRSECLVALQVTTDWQTSIAQIWDTRLVSTWTSRCAGSLDRLNGAVTSIECKLIKYY